MSDKFKSNVTFAVAIISLLICIPFTGSMQVIAALIGVVLIVISFYYMIKQKIKSIISFFRGMR